MRLRKTRWDFLFVERPIQARDSPSELAIDSIRLPNEIVLSNGLDTLDARLAWFEAGSPGRAAFLL